jgi:L-ascorbate metabolism protein UlaG (beta-lactamase superfamily)
MEYKLIRHATSVIQFGGLRLLIDPMLSPVGALPPVPRTPNMRANPLVALPIEDEKLDDWLLGMDAILVTHTHPDHFDKEAEKRIRKEIPIICQPEDVNRFKRLGFTEIHPVMEELIWKGITIFRTGCQHGKGIIRVRMGPVSGFVLRSEKEPILYIAGDTIWCPEVENALKKYKPDIVIVNAGAARFLLGGRITMSGCDISPIARRLPNAKIIAVHMEAYNHCLLSRKRLREFADRKEWSERIFIPNDGATFSL